VVERLRGVHAQAAAAEQQAGLQHVGHHESRRRLQRLLNVLPGAATPPEQRGQRTLMGSRYGGRGAREGAVAGVGTARRARLG